MKMLSRKVSLKTAIKRLIPPHIDPDDIYIACIGTDRSTGDSYGPLVGTLLTKANVKNVIGTLEDPLHAVNLDERIGEIPKGRYVIAIDACLGQASSVGTIKAKCGAIMPGAGVGKSLPSVGDMHITAIVNVGGFMEYFVLQNTRLHLVMGLAETTAKELKSALSMHSKNFLSHLIKEA